MDAISGEVNGAGVEVVTNGHDSAAVLHGANLADIRCGGGCPFN
jgi:hypothetical protein